jgi:hypothetical protein
MGGNKMKKKSLAVIIGNACLVLVLAALLLTGACSGPATTTESTTTTSITTSTTQTSVSPCEALLTSFQKPDVTLISAKMVAATKTVPEHCEILGNISPKVGFAVELPTNWNGKFYMVGNGVFAGNIEYGAMEIGLSMGYATASTDTGHDARLDPFGSLGASFAYDNPQAEIDYAYRAVHVTAETAKAIIEAYYGSPPSYSYFVGCSTGGRQGMMEAQRYPLDFDGIIVGSPVLNFTGVVMWGIWNAMALSGNGSISDAELKVLANAVYDKCDAADGLLDGLINNPPDCTFNPTTDLPPGSFTTAQIQALEKIYGGVRNSHGDLLFPGAPLGAEVFAGALSGWNLWMIGFAGSSPLQLQISDSFMKYMAFETDAGPGYDWHTFNFDTDPAKMAYISSIIDATNPDLSAFKAHGGKIIHYHGWADMALNPYMSVDYYQSVLDLMGVDETMDFYRLYMVPGMFHCSGGVGCDVVDWFSPLVNWVEKGIAPEELIGSQIAGSKVVRTRPFYPYPGLAVYKGSGSIDDAANFTCSGCWTTSTTTESIAAVLYEVCPCHLSSRKCLANS